jgi:hypothetical protein
MRFPGMLLALFTLTLGVVPSAHALPRTRPAEPPGIEVPPNALPADPGVSPAALVDAARRLPAAVLAMRQLADAGYVRTPDADVARSEGGHACVTLAFSDPSHPARAPLVIVRSDPGGDPAEAAVASAVFDVNMATGEVQLAPDAPYNAECIVTTRDANSTRPDNYIVSTGAVRTAFMKWIGCAIAGCTAGAAGCVTVGAIIGPLGPPAIAGCTIAACAVASFVCMW